MICARNEGNDAGGKISLLNAAIIPTSPAAAAEGEEGGREAIFRIGNARFRAYVNASR